MKSGSLGFEGREIGVVIIAIGVFRTRILSYCKKVGPSPPELRADFCSVVGSTHSMYWNKLEEQ